MTEQELGALRKVNRYALYSAAAGLVPIPLVDVAAIAGVQVKMLSVLAKHYDLPFKAERGKALVSALIGGLAPTALGYGMGGWLVRQVPIVGTTLGIFTVSVFASASTYAVGKVFIQHFESGGTFLDFNPDAVRAHFADEFQKAKTTV